MLPIIDIILLIVLALVTWSVAAEGFWGGAIVFLSVVFAGLLAMNFFEPLAMILERTVASSPPWNLRWDVIALIGLFSLFVFLFRLAGDRLLPVFVSIDARVYEVGRWAVAFMTGYATIAFLLCAVHTARLPREFIGFTPERNNLFGVVAPDRQWLGFTQYVSEGAFSRDHVFDNDQNVPQVPEKPGAVHPSFPIRYATRRMSLASASTAAPTNTAAPVRAPVRPATVPAF